MGGGQTGVGHCLLVLAERRRFAVVMGDVSQQGGIGCRPRFEGKGGAFSSGLQVADLLGRPCAEKVLSPDSDPIRWAEFRAKLCPGRETKNSLIGLKIVPWDASFSDIWRDPAEKS